MKRYILILNILLITSAVYYGVNGFYKTIAAKLDNMEVSLKYVKKSSGDNRDVVRPLSYYNSIFEHNLFGVKPETEEKPKQFEIDTLKQTELRLKLWGTVIESDGRAYAVIEQSGEEQQLYRVGDSVQNATVKMILREKIVLTVNGKDEILEMEKMLTTKTIRPLPNRRASIQSQNIPLSVQSQNISLKRSQIETAVQNVGELMQEIRIRPHFDKGKLDGLIMTGIKPDSIFRKMGLVSGDILTAVDGEEIQSVEDALRLYKNLSSAASVKVDIKRRGRARTIKYTIEEG